MGPPFSRKKALSTTSSQHGLPEIPGAICPEKNSLGHARWKSGAFILI